jgi:hypothetical protein
MNKAKGIDLGVAPRFIIAMGRKYDNKFKAKQEERRAAGSNERNKP